MVITLFKNGHGMPQCESAEVKSGKLLLEFVGAPEYSIVTIEGEKNTLRKQLSADGKCEIDVKGILGENVKFSVSAVGKVWHCDGIRVDELSDGTVRVISLSNHVESFAECFKTLEALRLDLNRTKAELANLREKFERSQKEYNII